MFKITPNGTNRLDVKMSGKLDTDSMQIALDEFAAKSKNIENGKMLYEINDFQLPTLGQSELNFHGFPRCLGSWKNLTVRQY